MQRSEYTLSASSAASADKRVKTLHPAIHDGLFARAADADRVELRDLGWEAIDLVAINLYPFE